VKYQFINEHRHHHPVRRMCRLLEVSRSVDYIEVFYNRQRRHSHLGGVSPEAFEQASF